MKHVTCETHLIQVAVNVLTEIMKSQYFSVIFLFSILSIRNVLQQKQTYCFSRLLKQIFIVMTGYATAHCMQNIINQVLVLHLMNDHQNFTKVQLIKLQSSITCDIVVWSSITKV